MQQISCRAAAPSVVAKRTTVKACAIKDWQKKATATVLSTMFVASIAVPAMAQDSLFGDEELLKRIKVRVCAENPTAQICIPKRTEIYDALLQELKASTAGQ